VVGEEVVVGRWGGGVGVRRWCEGGGVCSGDRLSSGVEGGALVCWMRTGKLKVSRAGWWG
jgi:hypothetical protein